MKIEDITQEQKNEFRKMSQSKIRNYLLMSCRNGNVDIVNYLLTHHYRAEEERLIFANYMFSLTVSSNDLNMLKCLLNSPKLKEGIDIEEIYNKLLFSACSSGLIEMVEYINIMIRENQIKIDLLNAINILEEACKVDNLQILKYIHEIIQEVNIEEDKESNKCYQYGFIKACERGYVDIVDFLLTLNKNIPLIDIHQLDDQAFISACYNKKNQLLEYFIFDYKIEKTLAIDALLDTSLFNEVKKMFERREFEEKLHKGLNQDNQKNNKIKI